VGKIRIDGIEVELERCGHCGLVPTKLDARKAIETVRKTHGRPCPACELAVAIKSISIQHANRTGKRGKTHWKATSVVLQDAVGLELQGYEQTHIHLTCVKRLFDDRIKKGSIWRPWYENSTFTVTGS
jgi:hypothetical protein